MEQFAILLIGAFAVMLAITLALQSQRDGPDGGAQTRFSWIQIVPVLLSTLALIASGFTIYFTFFWHFEDFVVYLRFPQPWQQLGTNTLDVSYFFSNTGNRTVFIEGVAIDELWIKSDHPGSLGPGIEELDRCIDYDLFSPTFKEFVPFSPSLFPTSQIVTKHSPIVPTRPDYKPLPGVLLATVRPAKINIDGVEVKVATTPVEAGKMKAIGATFETEPLPATEYNVVAECPVINLFDSRGQPILAVCKGWQRGYLSGPAASLMGGSLVGGDNKPGRLLPISSSGICRTYRTSGDAPAVGETPHPAKIPKLP
jgi:hypothetical protein